MLVRALKVLDYLKKELIGTASTRQPLISRAMERGLMTEAAPNGNR
jgi:hypothetical protein